MQWDQL